MDPKPTAVRRESNVDPTLNGFHVLNENKISNVVKNSLRHDMV
jgi:hypothetical protein